MPRVAPLLLHRRGPQKVIDGITTAANITDPSANSRAMTSAGANPYFIVDLATPRADVARLRAFARAHAGRVLWPLWGEVRAAAEAAAGGPSASAHDAPAMGAGAGARLQELTGSSLQGRLVPALKWLSRPLLQEMLALLR